MSLIYLIGGGNLQTTDNYHIDKDIIKNTKKLNPQVLFISAASSDNPKNIQDFTAYYEKLGAKVKTLELVKKSYSNEEIINLFKESDVIYIGGGHTEVLIETALKYELKEIILKFLKEDKIFAGISAGAIMFFEYGYGDYYSYLDNFINRDYRLVKGLGIFKGIIVPHYQNKGMLSFNDLIKELNYDAYLIEDNTCLKVAGNSFTILKGMHHNCFYFDLLNDHLLVFLKEDSKYKISRKEE